jgi:hypothetical protein
MQFSILRQHFEDVDFTIHVFDYNCPCDQPVYRGNDVCLGLSKIFLFGRYGIWYVARMGIENIYKILLEISKEEVHLGDLGVERRILLNRNLKKLGVKLLIGCK